MAWPLHGNCSNGKKNVVNILVVFFFITDFFFFGGGGEFYTKSLQTHLFRGTNEMNFV